MGNSARLERGLTSPNYVAPALVGKTLLASALAGYQFFHDQDVVLVFAGLEGSAEALMGGDGVFLGTARF